jgi:hypothetical protein
MCQPASVRRSSACSRETELARITSSPSWLRPMLDFGAIACAAPNPSTTQPAASVVSTFERR